MKVTKQEEIKSQVELLVELSVEDFAPYIKQGADRISKEVKIDGFRPGKVPYEVLKQKIGEMGILEESARIAIGKTLEKALLELGEGRLVGQPKIDIVKLAPGNPMQYKVLVALIPEITLGKYKELGLKQDKVEVGKDDVEKTLNELKEMKAKEMLADRAIKEGDKVLVDIEMFHDKVPVEGGQARDTAVLIGENNLVPGFDKQLVGAKTKDRKNFSLPYPADHYMKNIAGKMVDFKVEIKAVYERLLPEIDDDFAQSFGLKNIAEMKDNIKKGMEAEKKKDQARQIEKKMIEKILEKTKFGAIPDMLVEQESRSMLSELEQGITEQGGKYEDYLKSIGKTEAELTLDMLADAIKRVKASLVIREVALVEKIAVKPEEIDEHIKHMKSHYQDKPDILKRLDSIEYRNYIVNVQTSRKVIDKLMKWNIVKS
jgi:trigger factor